MTRRCGRCSALVDSAAEFCSDCGVRLAGQAAAFHPNAIYRASTPEKCPRCQATKSFGASRCNSCNFAFPITQFTTGVPGIVSSKGEPAAFAIRFAAFIIDLAISGGMAFGVSIAILYMLGVSGETDTAEEIELKASISYLIGFGAYAAYHVALPALWGTMVGKRIFRIYILNVHGERKIGFSAAFLRLLGTAVSSFMYAGYIMVAFRDDKRALHDLVANTYPTRI